MPDQKLVRVFHTNKTKGDLLHGEHRLSPGSYADVPQDVADLWLSHTHYGSQIASLQAGGVIPKDPDVKLVEENEDLKTKIAGMEALLKQLQEGQVPDAIKGTSPSPEELADKAADEAKKPKKKQLI